MWSDNETNSDLIDYQHLVGAVTEIINNEQLLPCSIGIFGDWGSGKSSLMKMIVDQYKDDKDVLIVKFNGWLFEGYEDSKTVLMGRIVDEIVAKRTFSAKGIKIAARLLKKIDVLKLTGTALKYGLSYAALGPAVIALASTGDVVNKLKEADYEKYIKDKQEGNDTEDTARSNIQEFHQNFEELIEDTKIKKIIVVIDDLDRCSTDTVIGTLEAIKLFLFTKKTAFIIGADERLIKYAVKRRFPEIPGDSTEVARDYLEKLIQYPVRIPSLSTIELINYVNLLFTQLHIDIGEFEFVREAVIAAKKSKGFDFIFNNENAADFIKEVTERQKEAYLLCSQIVPILSVGLNGNPRQCKRFLNTLLLRVKMGASKDIVLNRQILAKMMLLEYFKPETFRNFYESQSQNSGTIKNIEILEEKAALKETTDKKSGHGITVEEEGYLHDDWLRNWLESEPSLKNINLQPYFYFSRDKLFSTGSNYQRMSPRAQELYRKLLSDSQATVLNGLTEVDKLNSGDAAAIFVALAEKVQAEDDHSGDKSFLKKLVDFTKKRPELLSQFISYIEKIPEKILPISIVTWMLDITEHTDFAATAKSLLKKWSNSQSNSSLAKIADKKLKK